MPQDLKPADFISEAAPGVEKLDVAAINRKDRRQLYATRQKIYPRLARGRFRTVKWAVMAITLSIYYALPWLRWDRGPNLPDQAVLLDFANGRLFLFFLEIWPQELYYITGILVISALSLFLVTAAAGRVWCGYTCPQTVWTDLMLAVERFWQGDRNARIRLDKEPWSATKIFKKVMTHLSWLAIGLATGGALVFYFRDAPTLAAELVTGTAPAIAYLFLGIFTFTTYLLGGIAREQVCIYMCPWPRIQGAMVDRHTLLVSYRPERGEPRGPLRKGQGWEGRGDCIDCKACVAVCPMGIDIRDGAQFECIQCALCIDACNEIMDKIGRPRGLISYDTVAKQEAKAKGVVHEPLKLVRPRTILYSGLIALVAVVMALGLVSRTTLEVNVLHDRGVLFVPLSDGGVRNGYTVKVLNKQHVPVDVVLSIDGLQGAAMRIVGHDAGDGALSIPADNLREVRVLVTVPPEHLGQLTPPSTRFDFVVKDVATGTEMRRDAIFQSASGRS
jgi:cytochrome c oxidase accessory protein FixG